MNAIAANDSVTALVRRHDPDRFLTALFAPVDRRDALMTLYGFNHELARAPEVASQPMLALIRLQWWREVVEGVPKRHEIASPLSIAIAAGRLDPVDLIAIIEARERQVEEPFETLQDWQAWLWQGAGGVSVAAARLLGAPTPELFRRFGAAYGGAGLLRSTAILARAGRCLLPADALAAEGLSPEAAIADAQAVRGETDAHSALGRVQTRLAGEVMAWLGGRSRIMPRSLAAAALPAVFARRDLAGVRRGWQPRGLGDRLAVVMAGVTGRV